MRLVIDSSVFVAAFREDEPFSREAFSIIQQLDGGKLWAAIPVIVPLEVMAAVRRRTGDTALARTVGERILSMRTVSLVDLTTFRLTQLVDVAVASGLRGMDAVVVGVAQEFGIPLLTLDTEMQKRAKSYARCLHITDF